MHCSWRCFVFLHLATPGNRLKTTFKGTWLNRALSWLPWGVSFTIWLAILGGSGAGFLALVVSLIETGSVRSLIGAIVTGISMVIGVRALPHASTYDRMLLTVIIVLFLTLLPLGFAFGCPNKSMRLTLWVLGGLLLLGNGVYFVRSKRAKPDIGG